MLVELAENPSLTSHYSADVSAEGLECIAAFASEVDACELASAKICAIRGLLRVNPGEWQPAGGEFSQAKGSRLMLVASAAGVDRGDADKREQDPCGFRDRRCVETCGCAGESGEIGYFAKVCAEEVVVCGVGGGSVSAVGINWVGIFAPGDVVGCVDDAIEIEVGVRLQVGEGIEFIVLEVAAAGVVLADEVDQWAADRGVEMKGLALAVVAGEREIVRGSGVEGAGEVGEVEQCC